MNETSVVKNSFEGIHNVDTEDHIQQQKLIRKKIEWKEN